MINAVEASLSCADSLSFCIFMFFCHSHENSSGYYRTSVYFLSKIFADLLPNRIIPIIVFSAIVYFMMGNTHLRPTWRKRVQLSFIVLTSFCLSQG